MFTLRQSMLYLVRVFPPEGMIWFHPGLPSFVIKYDTVNDLCFDGHMSILTLLCQYWYFANYNHIMVVVTIQLCVFTLFELIVLRVHYTIDIYSGIMSALAVFQLMYRVSPQSVEPI